MKQEKKIANLIEDLSSLESYISDLFTFLPVPICLVSPLGVVLEFNPAFEKISGHESHEIIGEGVEKIFEKKEIDNLIKEIRKEGEVESRETMLLTKKRDKIEVDIFIRPRKDNEKKIVGFFIGVFDLTKIKKSEKELQEKVEELQGFQRLAVGRELKMVELKREIEKLKQRVMDNG